MLAFAGMAERLADIRKDEYIAGFFRRTIIQDLCFEYRGYPRFRLQGPSWSWASTCSRIFNNEYHDQSSKEYHVRDMVEFLGYELELKDPNNRYGAVISASLKMKAQLIDVEVEADSGTGTKRIFLTTVVGVDNVPRFDVDMDVPWATASYSLLLLSARWHNKGGIDLQGLVLYRVGDVTFLRIGCSLYTAPEVLGVWETKEEQVITLI